MSDTPPDPWAPLTAGPARPAELPEPQFQAWVGRWEVIPPVEVARLFDGAPFRWWIAGGWALELAGRPPRHHDDTDVAVLVADLPTVRAWLCDFHLWAPDESGCLRPILPGTRLRPDDEQLWVRRDAAAPWILDLLLTPSTGGDGLFKRDQRIRRSLDEIEPLLGRGAADWLRDALATWPPLARPVVAVHLLRPASGRQGAGKGPR